MIAALTRFETQGYDSPAHLWEIKQTGRHLTISTRWEGEPHSKQGSFNGSVMANEAAFSCGSFKAILVDPQHFIIYGWDTNDVRGNQGAAYDVVFSRPGIAELTAHSVWEKHKNAETLKR
jgi:hypothetical protein